MASKLLIIGAVAVLLVCLPALSQARQYMVGGYHGWGPNYNYNKWASNKYFQVGDSLVFKYQRGSDSVYQVNSYTYNSCMMPPPSQAMTSGYDMVYFKSPGHKYYMSGKGHGKYCMMGEKMHIYVNPGHGYP